MAVTKKEQRHIIDQVLVLLGVVACLLLLVGAGIAWKAYDFATTQVETGLGAQNIFFPEKGDPKFSPETYPTLQKYAGQRVDDGEKAKLYANDYIGAHLKNIAGGKTYAEVSTAAMQDPTNQVLQAQKQTLFQGETLRGLLLTAGYSFWTMGILARDAAVALLVGSATMATLVVLGIVRIVRQS